MTVPNDDSEGDPLDLDLDPEVVEEIARLARVMEEMEGPPCPHARPSWRMCPHCLGVNG